MSAISNALEKLKVKQCVFRKILLELDEDDMIAINEAVSKGLSGYVIANALREGGYQIAHSTVSQHILGRCKCNGSN